MSEKNVKKSISETMSEMYDTMSSYELTKGWTDGDAGNLGNGPNVGTYQVGRTFIDAGGANQSYKSNFTRDDYEYYNGNEANPRTAQRKISLCMRAYDRVGIVRNVIDLMGDFTVKGITITHPNLAEDRFFKEWWEYIDGDMVSERFANYLYRIGNVPVTTTYGKVPVKIEKQWSSANAALPVAGRFTPGNNYLVTPQNPEDINITKTSYETRRIPLKYSFINPLILEVISPELAIFTGKTVLALRVNPAIAASIEILKTKYPSLTDADIKDLIPSPILSAVKQGKTLIGLDEDNIKIYFYRKDDWEVWAKPLVSAVLEDLIMFEKMKLTDMAALNGAISSIRLWNVGLVQGDNPQNWIIPTKAMISKVRDILAQNVGGGTMDFVWGPDLKFTESQTRLHEFLGAAKYQPILANIYDGLGVPLGAGAGANGKGLSNNFIAMQTFVERLEYGRRVLQNFWNEQIKKVQLAMGYSKPAIVTFDQINLGDDSTYKQALLGLVDRDILSNESVLENFGYEASIEKIRLKREQAKREGGKAPKKASPFHDPNKDPQQDMKNQFVQSGNVTPSQVGLDLPPPKPGEKTPNEVANEHKIAQDTNKGKFKPVGKAGRPNAAKDGKKRKQKRPPIQTKASTEFTNMTIWGNEAQKKISDIVTPQLLKAVYKKPNVRSLTTTEFEELEGYKFKLFSHAEPFTKIDPESVVLLTAKAEEAKVDVLAATKVMIATFMEQTQREPTVDEIRQLQSSGFALAYAPEIDSELDTVEGPTNTDLELTTELI